ncbi:MAG TPA: DUF1189 domain-containing protein [Tepidisphaeraceae bacterium]|jgi:ABC-type sugar transport system permease subunit
MEPAYPAMPPVQRLPERRKHSRLTALVLSFFSPDLYRDVARRWRGIGFLYLVLLLAVSWLPVAAKIQVSFTRFVQHDAARVLAGFPAITINNGVVSIDRPEPYVWRDADSGEVILYVDTTNAFDTPEAARAKVKLGRSQMIVKQSEFETRSYDLSQFKSFYVNRARLLGWMQVASYWIGLGIFVFGLVFTLIWHVIQVLIYGAIGLLLAMMMNARGLDYPALVRLAAVAITPAILLSTAFDLTGAAVPYAGWLFFALEMGYLAFAVKANVEPAVAPPPPPPFPAYPPPMPPAQPGNFA